MPRMLGASTNQQVIKGGANEGEGRGSPYDCFQPFTALAYTKEQNLKVAVSSRTLALHV
jgi:hypothetical protein